MSDLETMKQMLVAAGIEFEVEEEPNGETRVRVWGGYPGFFTVMTFSAFGELLKMEAYE